MKEILSTFYAIDISMTRQLGERTGYQSGEYIYFTMSPNNKEAIHMEQAVLAYHLLDVGYTTIALPIPNIYGDWVTTYSNGSIIVFKASVHQGRIKQQHGQQLAHFHRLNRVYEYEPQNISSYGQWKQLWIDKLTICETKLVEEARKQGTNYHRLTMNILPFFIGISENAIQYIHEIELDPLFDDSDQGTLTFTRYRDQLLQNIIWPDHLMYDHQSRDIAEYIRTKLLYGETEGWKEGFDFLNEYETVQSLSPFSWELLYARLLYPLHLFDCFEAGFIKEDYEKQYVKLQHIVAKQPQYEYNLNRLFAEVMHNYKNGHISMVQWIQ